MAEPSTTPAVTRADADVANSGPAVWANRFMVMRGPMVKVAFMEQGGPGEPLYFRSAIAMSQEDAIALKNLLTEILPDAEQQLMTAQALRGKSSNG
jgi:hypothetical protein